MNQYIQDGLNNMGIRTIKIEWTEKDEYGQTIFAWKEFRLDEDVTITAEIKKIEKSVWH
jgi:hypothetical protein